MPRLVHFTCIALLGTGIFASHLPRTALAQAPAPAAQAPGASAPDGLIVRQFSLRVADPMELAAILTLNHRVVATGSASTGTVTVTAASGRIEEIAAHIEEFDQLAETRQRERREADRMRQMAADDQARAREAMARDVTESKSIAIDFAGGTLGEYLALVAKTSKVGNIIIGDDRMNALRMPPIRVRKITGTAAVLLLESLRFNFDGTSAAIGVQHVPGDPEAQGIEAESVLVLDLLMNEQPTKSVTVRTEIFDLQDAKQDDSQPLPAIIDAVRAAVELNGASEHFKLSLHEGTGLLFARGSDEELDVAIRTVEALTRRSRK
jgi:hypothetical protein